jgi:hypothetical protein
LRELQNWLSIKQNTFVFVKWEVIHEIAWLADHYGSTIKTDKTIITIKMNRCEHMLRFVPIISSWIENNEEKTVCKWSYNVLDNIFTINTVVDTYIISYRDFLTGNMAL